jgi:rRNA-processing protein FCF1
MASNRIRRDRDAKIVILDSSAIMMLFEFSIDLEKEIAGLVGVYHMVVPTSIVRELEFLSKNGIGNKKMKAKASLKFIEKFETIDVDEKNGDDSIVELAKKTKGIVVTNDMKLRNRLKEISISVIFLRAKKKLVMN